MAERGQPGAPHAPALGWAPESARPARRPASTPPAAQRRPHGRGVERPADVLEEPRRRPSAPPCVDIGGGTGGFAVRVAELGHQVTVVDPSPDALATLGRRADETGVADRVTGRQGDLADLDDLVPARQRRRGALPRRPRDRRRPRRGAARRSPRCSVPAARSACWSASGTRPWSPGRWPGTSARRGRCSTSPGRQRRRRTVGSPPTRSPRCSTRPGSTPPTMHARPGLRRPGAQLAGRPRARCRRRPWSSSSARSPTRPEYLTLATQIHTLAMPPLTRAPRRPRAAVSPVRPASEASRGVPDPARRHGRVLRLCGDPRPARAPGRPGHRGRRPPGRGAVGQLPGPRATASARRCR